jgi:hypothetical protein
MRKKINIVLSVCFVILLALIIWINYLMKNHIGDIEYDSSIDDSSFFICNKKYIYEYYSIGTSYIGERKAIREEVFNQIEKRNLVLDRKSGVITFRFVVNCKSETGRYRYKAINSDFSETTFKDSEVEKLKTIIKGLKNWVSGVNRNGDKVDSYYQINFKIKEGIIIDIF